MHIHSIIRELNYQGISYCHWKSNSHLKASFEGLTDFDILIARKDRQKFIKILNSFGFKRFEC